MAQDLETIEPLANSLLHFVAKAVEDPTIDVAKLEALLRMQREIIADDAKMQFNRDFIAMQAELPRVKRNGVLEYPVDKTKPDGPKRKISNYAMLEDIDEAIRPIRLRHGFGVAYTTRPRVGDGGGLEIVCILRHRAGHSSETPFPVPLDTSGGKNNIQGAGSAATYGRRYALIAALDIQVEGKDDDAKLAGMRFISAAEAAELDALITETYSDRGRFLQHFGIAALENMEVGGLIAARNMLLAKRRKATP